MKAQSIALTAHRQQGTTTMAWCWRVERRDGLIFGFTSVDVPLTIDGVTYAAATGIDPSAVQGNADLAVRNMEAVGMLDSSAITEEDLLAGLWDGAAVEIFEVNHRDLSMGRMQLASGTLGAVSTGKQTYNAEVRGLSQALQRNVGEVVAAGCQAVLGDARCGVDVEALRVSFTVTSVTNGRTFTASALAGADDEYGAGEVTWVTGANATYRMEVRSHTTGGNLVLSLPMVNPIAVGDTGTIIPGCRKRFTEDCQGRYNNVINFRGFPHLPGNNRILGAGGLVGGQ